MNTFLVIPTIDRPELLKRAVASALRQDRPFSKILIVDNGETPLPKGTCPGTEIIRGVPYPSVAEARFIAIPYTQWADAVCYLDDDDELLPHHNSSLSKQIEDGAAFAFSKALFKAKDGTETVDPEPWNLGKKRYYDPTALLEQNIAPVSSFIHTVSAAKRVGWWDPTMERIEDWDFWGRLFIEFGPPRFVDDVTNVIYRGTNGNLTGSRFSYSMCCSWRDIVSDRLRHLAKERRGLVKDEDRANFKIPTIGIVMPFHNAQQYLPQAIESILAQDYRDFELIGINDGSSDSSRDIFCSYMSKDSRLRMFETGEKQGVTKALNFGLLVSRSKYIARMDADDWSAPERLGLQARFLDANRDVMVVGSNFSSMDESLTRVIWENRLPLGHNEIRKELLRGWCCIGHPTVMMRRRAIEVVDGYDESADCKGVEDYDMWLRISRKYKIANLSECLFKYRTHKNQVSQQIETVQSENVKKVLERHKKEIGEP